jgi:hypothetical protein
MRRHVVPTGEDGEAIIDDLRADLTTSMKARPGPHLDPVTRHHRGTAAETSGSSRQALDGAAVLAVIRSEVKKRNEAAEIYTQAGRTEQAASERQEAELLAAYLPVSSTTTPSPRWWPRRSPAGGRRPQGQGQGHRCRAQRVGDQADGAASPR